MLRDAASGVSSDKTSRDIPCGRGPVMMTRPAGEGNVEASALGVVVGYDGILGVDLIAVPVVGDGAAQAVLDEVTGRLAAAPHAGALAGAHVVALGIEARGGDAGSSRRAGCARGRWREGPALGLRGSLGGMEGIQAREGRLALVQLGAQPFRLLLSILPHFRKPPANTRQFLRFGAERTRPRHQLSACAVRIGLSDGARKSEGRPGQGRPKRSRREGVRLSMGAKGRAP